VRGEREREREREKAEIEREREREREKERKRQREKEREREAFGSPPARYSEIIIRKTHVQQYEDTYVLVLVVPAMRSAERSHSFSS
jgi:hypothetical protein